MSTPYQERESAAARPRNYYSAAHQTYSYDADGEGERHRRNPTDKKKALNRLRELRPLVDRIINQCTIESKEVKSGLQQIKDYQTGVLDELRDIVEEEDDKASYYEVRQSSAEGYNGPSDDLYGLRDQKEHLRNQLQGEVRVSTRLAEDYQLLEYDYNRLREDVERLKRKNRFDAEPAPERKQYREDLGRTRPFEDVPRVRSRSKQVDDYTGRQVNNQARRSQEEDVYDENQRLKQQLNDAYNTIDSLKATVKDLERKLNRAEDELERNNYVGSRKSPERVQQLQDEIDRLSAELHKARSQPKGGDLSRQLAQLKQQNQDLRVETIRLLKLKSSGGVNQEVSDLQNEIMNLHDSIERENDAKLKFIEEMDEYKRKFAALEAQNQELKARGRTQYAAPGYETVSVEYHPSGGAIYNEMATVLDYGRGGDDKLSKYKGFLNEIKTYKPYG